MDVGGPPSVCGHSLTPCVCGSWLQSLVWQVDEAALLAVAPKHLLFTGSSCVLRGDFSPSRAVLFDRYFTSRGGGCFYFPHMYINHSARGGCLPDAFP